MVFDLEGEIGSWKQYLLARSGFVSADIEELEAHLRDQIDGLQGAGLSQDEAFLISVKRIGNADAVRETREISHDWTSFRKLVSTLYRPCPVAGMRQH